jgi:hypothetical protein
VKICHQKKKKKNRLNVLISFISVAKMLKIWHKEKHQVQHIYFETYGSKCSNKETPFFFFFKVQPALDGATCLGLAMKQKSLRTFVLHDFVRFSTQLIIIA